MPFPSVSTATSRFVASEFAIIEARRRPGHMKGENTTSVILDSIDSAASTYMPTVPKKNPQNACRIMRLLYLKNGRTRPEAVYYFLLMHSLTVYCRHITY